jgi:oxygen-dependent protoporphyrinogen oxidase
LANQRQVEAAEILAVANQVIVIGGGIAGLSCTWRLYQAGVDVVILEAQTQAGGNVTTHKIDGFLIEQGPHTFMGSAGDIFTLAEEVGIADQIVATLDTAKKRFIARDGRLHPVFTGPWSFLTSRLLSFKGKCKLIGEPFRTTRGQPSDNARQFFERRFGPEAADILAGAFVSGIYAGDMDALSAPAAFGLFWGFEQEAGSMIRGAIRHRKRQKRAAENKTKRRKGLYSFRQGLGQLSQAIAEKLGDHLITDAAVTQISVDGNGYRIISNKGEFTGSRLVIATPPQQAGQLLHSLRPDLSKLVSSIPMAPMAVVRLGFSEKQNEIPNGFGFLAPRSQNIRTLGVLFPARLFSNRTPGDGDLLIGFVGGMLDQEAVKLSDLELIEIVTNDLAQLTKWQPKHEIAQVVRYPQAIPQFELGHLEKMAKIEKELKSLSGLHLAGNYLRGIGMKDAVASGFEAADKILSKGTCLE